MNGVGTDLRPGSELLGYRVERALGRGGMGVVYLAQQLALDRMVALKLLAPELAGDADFRERFLRESRLAASLDHPNIVPVFDAGATEDGRLYIAMRYVEGTDLRRLLDGEGPLAPDRTLALLTPVADALDTAHAKGLVHHDVKPSNILLDQQQRPYLADFGLSRSAAEGGLVEPSHFAASLDYVAPEQIERQPVGPAADQYALACVLRECLSGTPPYRRDTPLATLWAHVSDPPPQTGGPIDPVLAKALAKDPDQRYESCSELIDSASRALGVRAAPARISRKTVLLAVAVAVLLAAALTAGLALTIGGGSSTPKPSLAVTDTSLVRVDPETNRIAAVIDVGPGPKAVAVGGRIVWVYNARDGVVSAIDAEKNEILRTTRVAGTPREAAPYNGPVLAAEAGFAWIVGTDAGGKGVLERVSASDIYKPAYPLRHKPSAIAVGDGAVWVIASGGLDSGENVLLRIDPTSGAVLEEIAQAGDGIAFGEGAVWVTDAGTAEMHRIDPATSAVTGSVDLSKGESAEPAAGSGFVWVATSDGLQRVHPATLRVTKTIPVVGTDYGYVADGFDVALHDGSVWVHAVRPGTVLRIDALTGNIISTTRLRPESPDNLRPFMSASIATGADSVWVAMN